MYRKFYVFIAAGFTVVGGCILFLVPTHIKKDTSYSETECYFYHTCESFSNYLCITHTNTTHTHIYMYIRVCTCFIHKERVVYQHDFDWHIFVCKKTVVKYFYILL